MRDVRAQLAAMTLPSLLGDVAGQEHQVAGLNVHDIGANRCGWRFEGDIERFELSVTGHGTLKVCG